MTNGATATAAAVTKIPLIRIDTKKGVGGICQVNGSTAADFSLCIKKTCLQFFYPDSVGTG